MKLIVGLGNPGEKYQFTRHNLGFIIADQFLKDNESSEKTIWENSDKFKSELAEIKIQSKYKKEEKVILIKPKTFMNNSGLAVSLISQFLNISISDIWVIHDDIDLPLGSIRIRLGGSSAGHRGLESIINNLKTEKFWRFRLGIGNPNKISNIKYQISNKSKIKDVEDFVLGKFGHDEVGKLKELIKRASKAINFGLEKGLESAMNKFNTK
ncbi:MAG: aminoacyl-tRNA hydrolase [Candidatus Levybacteria bacterium]|nr:aminoacyl-tRNA hydrolase [Candidatus Levybacteria bacterium]